MCAVIIAHAWREDGLAACKPYPRTSPRLALGMLPARRRAGWGDDQGLLAEIYSMLSGEDQVLLTAQYVVTSTSSWLLSSSLQHYRAVSYA
jgi:hypothetical protein